MHSYTAAAVGIGYLAGVLILVLMEDALVLLELGEIQVMEK